MATPEQQLSLKNQEKIKKIKSNTEDKSIQDVGGPDATWSTADYAKFSFDATSGVKPDTSAPSKAKVKSEKMYTVKEEEDLDDEDEITEELYAEEDEDTDDEGGEEESLDDESGDEDEEASDDEDDDSIDLELDDIGDDDKSDDLEMEDVADDSTDLIDLDKDDTDMDEAYPDMYSDNLGRLSEDDDEDVADDMEDEAEEGEDYDTDSDSEEEIDEFMSPFEEDQDLVTENVCPQCGNDPCTCKDSYEESISEGKIRIAFKLEESAKLFENNTVLSEEDKRQTRTLFESAVRVAAKQVGKQLQEVYQGRYRRAKKLAEAKMAKQMDQYLSYVVEQWAKENQVALQNQLRNKLTENFIRGLKNLFVEHYVEVPESKVNVVEALAKNVKTLKSQLKESEARSVRLHADMKNAVTRERQALMKEHKSRLIAEAASAVTAADRGKFAERAQTLSFSNTKSFKKDLIALRESYFAATTSGTRSIDVPDATPLFEETSKVGNVTKSYLAALDKMSKQS